MLFYIQDLSMKTKYNSFVYHRFSQTTDDRTVWFMKRSSMKLMYTASTLMAEVLNNNIKYFFLIKSSSWSRHLKHVFIKLCSISITLEHVSCGFHCYSFQLL